jgi:Outer membrane protein beta-barrel domain
MPPAKMRKRFAIIAAVLLFGGTELPAARANAGLFGIANPLGFYAGAGVGRSIVTETQLDQFASYYHVLDSNPLGWEGYMGLHPIPFLGVEAEYIDFGRAYVQPGPLQTISGSVYEQYLGGHADNRALAAFAVGYLPLPLPFIQPFAKVGFAWDREHDTYVGHYNDVSPLTPAGNGVPLGYASGSNSSDPVGVAYGAGIQLSVGQVAIRAQYLRVNLQRQSGQWNNPSLVSVGIDWTF